MVSKYVQAIDYLQFLSQKAEAKQAKEREMGFVNKKIAASTPKPLFTIDLPENMADLVFLKPKSNVESSSLKEDKKPRRFPSQKSMSGDYKDKISPKRKSHKTITIFPNAFDNDQEESEQHWTKKSFMMPSSQLSPQPSDIRDKIEFFKVSSNGRKHIRKRADPSNVNVGINGHSLEQIDIQIEDIQGKNLENVDNRVPVSWEDQIKNFPDEVKIIKVNQLSGIKKPPNNSENFHISPTGPLSRIIWRKMGRQAPTSKKPTSSKKRPDMEYANSGEEKLLPSSPSFVKGTALKNSLIKRYVEGSRPAKKSYKSPKTQHRSCMPQADKWVVTKTDTIAPYIFTFKTRATIYSNGQTVAAETKTEEPEIERAKKPKRKRRFTILPLDHPKPFPRDPAVMNEYFHVTKMDTWLQSPLEEQKTRKSRFNLEKYYESLHNGNSHKDQQSSPEKENQTNNSQESNAKEIQISFMKSLSIKSLNPKPSNQDEHDNKNSSAKVIHFKIPSCEIPNTEKEQSTEEVDSQPRNAEESTENSFRQGQNQKGPDCFSNRPITR